MKRFIPILLPLVAACNPQSSPVSEWMNRLQVARSEVQKQFRNGPYRGEQYQALKGYFGLLAEVAGEARRDEASAKALASALTKDGVEKFCAEFLVPASEWREMMAHCSQNRFFLCAEEVRAYPEAVSAIRDVLPKEAQEQFDQSAACRDTGNSLENREVS